MGPSR